MPKRERAVKVTDKDIAEALMASRGIVLEASKWLSVNKGVTITRSALFKRIMSDPDLQAIREKAAYDFFEIAQERLIKR